MRPNDFARNLVESFNSCNLKLLMADLKIRVVEDTGDLLVDGAAFVLINFAKSILDVLLLGPWTLFDLVPFVPRTQMVTGLILR